MVEGERKVSGWRGKSLKFLTGEEEEGMKVNSHRKTALLGMHRSGNPVPYGEPHTKSVRNPCLLYHSQLAPLPFPPGEAFPEPSARTPSVLSLSNHFIKETVYVVSEASIYLHGLHISHWLANCRQNLILVASFKLFRKERCYNSGRVSFQRPSNQQLNVLMWKEAEKMLKKNWEVRC